MASSSSQPEPEPLTPVFVFTRPHLEVSVRSCTLWTFNRSLSFANLCLVLEYYGIVIHVTQLNVDRQRENIHSVEAIFNYHTQIALMQPDPGGILVTVQNVYQQIMGRCWIVLSWVLPYPRRIFTFMVGRPDGEISGFVELVFNFMNVRFRQYYEGPQIAQETDPASNPSSAASSPEMAQPAPSSSTPSAENPSSATSAPEIAQSATTSSDPFSSPTAPPATAQSSVSVTFGSLTALPSEEDFLAELFSLIAVDGLQSTTAQSSSLTAAPLAEDMVQSSTAPSSSLSTEAPLAADVVQTSSLTADPLAADLGQSTTAQPSTSCTHGSSTAPSFS